MSEALKIAELYFTLSNKSDFEGIAKLLTASTLYISQNTGKFVGKDEIIEMQKSFHSNFSRLNWAAESVVEVKLGLIRFEYEFSGTKLNGDVVNSKGIEDVAIEGGKIVYIEIKNK